MTTKNQVIKLHRQHPTWTAPDIAARLGCLNEYVRATAQRNGLRLPLAILPARSGIGALGRKAHELGLTLKDLERAAHTKVMRP